MPDLWVAETLLEQDYQRVIKEALQAWQNERTRWREINAERDDYYTLWTHQIKTPIYSMDLMLQTGDTTPLTGAKPFCTYTSRNPWISGEYAR